MTWLISITQLWKSGASRSSMRMKSDWIRRFRLPFWIATDDKLRMLWKVLGFIWSPKAWNSLNCFYRYLFEGATHSSETYHIFIPLSSMWSFQLCSEKFGPKIYFTGNNDGKRENLKITNNNDDVFVFAIAFVSWNTVKNRMWFMVEGISGVRLFDRFAKFNSIIFVFLFWTTAKSIVTPNGDCLPWTWSVRRKQNTPADADKLATSTHWKRSKWIYQPKHSRHVDYIALHNNARAVRAIVER